MPKIKYRSLRKYKYQLMEKYLIRISLPKSILTPIFTDFIILQRSGKPDAWLTIKKGYAWNGASGPTFDTETSMRGSLVHDALYQLMREGYLDIECREYADDLLREILLEDGMNRFRAWLWWKNCRAFGARSARPKGGN